MSFQIGKYYQHTSGDMMAVVGHAVTTLYGKTLVAECTSTANLKPISMDEDAMVGWGEITKGKWLSNFSSDDGLPPFFTENILRLNTVTESLNLYTDTSVSNELEEIKKTKRSVYGYFDPTQPDPNTFSIDMGIVSHCVLNLRIENEILLGEIRILNTPRGRALLAAMQNATITFKPVWLVIEEDKVCEIRRLHKVKLLGVHAYFSN